MPRGDGTGPAGLGPMTGRRLGYCAGYNRPGFLNAGWGYGYGFGRGWGRGFGRGWGWFGYGRYPYTGYPYQAPSQKEEKEMLEVDAKNLEEELKAIKARLAELRKDQK